MSIELSPPQPKYRGFLILFLGLFIIGTLWVGGAFKTESVAPTKVYTIDGCDLYQFTDNGRKGYFAHCPNGRVATTYDDGKSHIVTERTP